MNKFKIFCNTLESICDTLESICDTQMCRDTQFEKHWDRLRLKIELFQYDMIFDFQLICHNYYHNYDF